LKTTIGKLLMQGGGGLVGGINTGQMTNAVPRRLCQHIHRHRSHRQQ